MCLAIPLVRWCPTVWIDKAARHPHQPHAQHYKNLIADPRASLIVLERTGDDVQVNGRLTCVANVVKVPQPDIDETAERYYRLFPESTDYHKVHDFEFFCFWPVRWCVSATSAVLVGSIG